MKCIICGKECAGECCSGACRAKKSRQKERAQAHGTIIDCTGRAHKIDYEGRHKNRALLDSWARGEGSEYQCRLGVLAAAYNRVDEQGYLGYI